MANLEETLKQIRKQRMPGDDELLGAALSDEDDAVLNQFMPEYSVTSRGEVVMAQERRELFEKMCARFGVPLSVSNSPEHYIKHAYNCFALTLRDYVAWRLEYSEKKFRRLLKEAEPAWSDDWIDYVEAVALNDAEKAKKLAQKLRVLDKDTEYPPGSCPYKYPEVRESE